MSKFPPVKNLPYCVSNAAEVLGVTVATANNWAIRGKLEKLRVVGSATLITPLSLRRRLREMGAEKKSQ